MRFVSLFFGLTLFALGIVLTLNAKIGYSPWEILHSGLSVLSGISIGMVSSIVGLAIGVIIWIRGEKFGIGSILNMVGIGLIMDLFLALGFIPVAHTLPSSILMLVAGLYTIALGSFFYIAAGFGAGPRDGLMLILTRVTHVPIGVVRSLIEFTAAFIGWLLGGMVGLGTVISVLAGGFCVQTTFKLFRFEPDKVTHETLQETIAHLRYRKLQDRP